MQKKRDKHVAGILALFFGWLGVHRYYLGENDRGILYTIGSGIMMWGGRLPFIGLLFKFLWVPLILLISIIDAVTFFAMDQRLFDEKYNGSPQTSRRTTRQEREAARREQREERNRKRSEHHNKRKVKSTNSRHNPFKKSGVEKFKEFDYAGAIGDFKKSLDLAPNDLATHFNIACAYSLTEKKDLAFYHLDLAVAHGFKDFDKIKNHHGLAYLRIQPEFEEFEENGFRLRQEAKTDSQKHEDDLLSTQPDLLDQLKKLGELRQNGLLTELEFEQQKKKLLG